MQHNKAGFPQLEKYLNIQDCLEKSLKINFALKVLAGFALGFIFLSPPFSPIRFFLCHFL